MFAALGLLLLPLAARADSREMQVVAVSTDIKAKPADVWNVVEKFDGLQAWHPAFPSTPLVKGKDGQVGAVRAVTVKDGPTFTEELLALNDADMAFTYGIVESPLPIDHYLSTMTVRPNASGGATVVWTGNFVRKNPRDNVPAAESDAGAVKFITTAYAGGLENLKKMMESR
ncbi:MAG: SRPBCC family protein [Pseudomonadota bacterium]|nr:SRPBCC family protein [Pseudomonadota bacterium]